jgi:hypothetical protein
VQHRNRDVDGLRIPALHGFDLPAVEKDLRPDAHFPDIEFCPLRGPKTPVE